VQDREQRIIGAKAPPLRLGEGLGWGPFTANSQASRLPKQTSKLLFDLTGGGEATGCFFGEEGEVAEGNFKNAAAPRNEGNAVREMLVVLVEDAFRQTGGFFDIASRGAVLNPDPSCG
jgi:hypothetical protein